MREAGSAGKWLGSRGSGVEKGGRCQAFLLTLFFVPWVLKTGVLNSNKNPTGISDVLLVVVMRFFHTVILGKLQSVGETGHKSCAAAAPSHSCMETSSIAWHRVSTNTQEEISGIIKRFHGSGRTGCSPGWVWGWAGTGWHLSAEGAAAGDQPWAGAETDWLLFHSGEAKNLKKSNLRQAGQDDGTSGQKCAGELGTFLAGSCDGLRTAVKIPCGIA